MDADFTPRGEETMLRIRTAKGGRQPPVGEPSASLSVASSAGLVFGWRASTLSRAVTITEFDGSIRPLGRPSVAAARDQIDV